MRDRPEEEEETVECRGDAVPLNRAELVRSDPSLGLTWVLVVASITLVGVVVIAVGSWEVGGIIIGAAMLVGAAIRAAVSREQAGLLRVRAKVTDVVFMAVVGLAIIALVVSRASS